MEDAGHALGILSFGTNTWFFRKSSIKCDLTTEKRSAAAVGSSDVPPSQPVPSHFVKIMLWNAFKAAEGLAEKPRPVWTDNVPLKKTPRSQSVLFCRMPNSELHRLASSSQDHKVPRKEAKEDPDFKYSQCKAAHSLRGQRVQELFGK